MLIAGIGDVHGSWRQAMQFLETACHDAGIDPKDLATVLQVGDAEPQRNADEAEQVPGPKKYRKVGDFADIVNGSVTVPAPLYFIAGNHEPFAMLDADGGLCNGAGNLAPGVTYLGRAGLATVSGLRVAFLSGIYGEKTFTQAAQGISRPSRGKRAAHYTPDELRTVRQGMRQGVDVLVTHDWPTGLSENGRFGPVGDMNVRALIEDFHPLLSLHGHMHRAHSAMIGQTHVECLAIVGNRAGDPFASIGIWDIDRKTRQVKRIK
jgi:hypothetical protein